MLHLQYITIARAQHQKRLENRYLTDLDREEDDLITTNSLIKKAEEDRVAAVADADKRKLMISAEATKMRADLRD